MHFVSARAVIHSRADTQIQRQKKTVRTTQRPKQSATQIHSHRQRERDTQSETKRLTYRETKSHTETQKHTHRDSESLLQHDTQTLTQTLTHTRSAYYMYMFTIWLQLYTEIYCAMKYSTTVERMGHFSFSAHCLRENKICEIPWLIFGRWWFCVVSC